MYNLSEELDSEFTLLLPTDEAVRQHLSKTNSSLLVGSDDISCCCWVITLGYYTSACCLENCKRSTMIYTKMDALLVEKMLNYTR